MRPLGITAKLFLAILGVTLTVVLLMALSTQLTFRSDFVDYLADRERERMEALAEVLADHYRARGGWQALQSGSLWRETLREAAWRHRHDDDEDTEDDEDEEHEEHEREAHREHRGGLMPQHHGHAPASPPFGPTLLDADGTRVAGAPVPPSGTESEPIRIAGNTVGYLVFQPPGGVTDRLARRFQHEQLEAAWLTAGVVVLLAAGVSVLLARSFLSPVRRLAQSTRALAAGRYDTRVDERRRDELGRLATDFNRLAAALQRNERLRREFMADMSHELRTPMAVLRAELEAMEDGIRPLTRESLARLQDGVATLSKLIDDLYQLSLSDAGALNYHMETLDLGTLIVDAAEPWRRRLADADLRLEVTVPSAPVTVSGDKRRLEQLVGNLLENSLRYTDPGGEVHVALAQQGDRAFLTVEDSAPGVPPESHERLFERLYRVEASRSRAGGGAGLGLAICRNIAAAHNGRIETYPAALGGLGVRLTLALEN